MKRFSILLFLLFSFQNLFAVDYYWVGGNGKWTDYSHHWATTSGGNIYHPQIPGPLDNVIIDNKSLSGKTTITLDQTIETCRNFSVSVSKDSLFLTSTAVDPKLSIYGSTSLCPMVKISSTIKLYFESSGNETYTQNGAVLPCFLLFNNIGSWRITDSINVASLVIFKGNIDASGAKITVQTFAKESPDAFINLSNTQISVYEFYLKKTSDITTGTVIYLSTKKYYTTPEINLSGNASIDSVFCSAPEAYVDLNVYDNSSIHYAQVKKCAAVSISGNIERLDIIDLSTITSYNANIGVFNISNARQIYLQRDLSIDKLTLTGDYNCHNMFSIIGDDDAPQKLNINTPPANFDYCSFTYVDASYNPIMASNAIDGGNNAGITFSSYALATTLYRIGDGLWSDITKWSYTSNGPPANCIPTVYTDVIFDAYSFTQNNNTIELNYATSFCKNFTVEQINSSILFDGILQCAGNFYSAIPLKYDGATFVFISNNTNTIKFNNPPSVNPGLTLLFSGKGTYNLLSDISCDFLKNDGSFINTNNYTIKATTEMRLEKGVLNASVSKIYSYSFYSKSANKLDFATIYASAYAEMNQNTYGTIILNGKSMVSLDGLISVKHLKIQESSVIKGGNISCDSLSINKGVVLNTSFMNNLEFGYFYNPGIQQCGKYTIIKPINSSTLKISSKHNVTFDYFLFENVQATGSVSYNATNSIDGLKNSGIVFTPTQSKSFYWIGGTGNWMNTAHWSFVSGGLSAQCVPSRNDHVFFDKNSFPNATAEQVFVDEFVECNNFVFSRTSQVTFRRTESNTSSLNSISVYGSFYSNNNSIFWTTVNFSGNKPSIVNANNSQLYIVVVDKSAKLSFTSDIQTYDTYLNNGSVEFKNTTFSSKNLNGSFRNKDSLVITNSSLNVTMSLSLSIMNGFVKSNSSRFNISLEEGSMKTFAIYDSIPVNLGSLYFQYSDYVNNTETINLALSNVILDTLYITSAIEDEIISHFYNVNIHALIASNNILTIKKDNFYYSMLNPDGDWNATNVSLVDQANLNVNTTNISNIHFKQLKVYPGNRLYIEPGDTLYIHKYLDVTGTPSHPIEIGSTNSADGFIQNNGSVCGEYLFIHDNHVLNKSAFAGYLSSDVQNNSGWNFNASCDTLFCSFDRIPCEGDTLQLDVMTNQILVDPVWKGPNGFTSTSISPQINKMSASNKGLYTFTSLQGQCSVYIDLFEKKTNNISSPGMGVGYISLEQFTSDNITWLYNNAPVPNETQMLIFTDKSGYYKAELMSYKGCKYTTDSLLYINAFDPTYQPELISIKIKEVNKIELIWNDIDGESFYFVSGSTPSNSDFLDMGNTDMDDTASIISFSDPGEYCFYVQAYIPEVEMYSSPSNTLCIMNWPDAAAIKPDLISTALTEAKDIEIKWKDLNFETGYIIYSKSPDGNETFTQTEVITENNTTFLFPNTGDGKYCFYIRASFETPENLSQPSDTLCINVQTQVTTGISSSISTKNISLYPNPTNTDMITIAPENSSGYSVSIETLQGERIYYKENQRGTIQVSINEYSQGVYLVRIQNDSFAACEKLIITK